LGKGGHNEIIGLVREKCKILCIMDLPVVIKSAVRQILTAKKVRSSLTLASFAELRLLASARGLASKGTGCGCERWRRRVGWPRRAQAAGVRDGVGA